MLQRFKCWRAKPKSPVVVENVVINYRFTDPLPETDVELCVIEHSLARRMSIVNKQMQKVNENYAYCQHRNNLQGVLKYAKEKTNLHDELRTLSMKFMEVTEKRNNLLLPKQA